MDYEVLNEIFSKAQRKAIIDAVTEMAREANRSNRRNMVTSLHMIAYKNIYGLPWAETLRPISKATCLRWLKTCSDLGSVVMS